MKGSVFAFTLGVLVALSAVADEGPRAAKTFSLAPVDEAAKDPEFAAFRKDLLDVVEKKDAKRLLAALAPKVQVLAGDPGGLQAFREEWSPDDPKSNVWRELKTILSLGGRFTAKGNARKPAAFLAPYTTSDWPKDAEPGTYVVITGKDVNVREKPDSKATVVAKVSHLVVPIVEEDAPREETVGGETYPWIHVRLGEGREGYVFGKFTRGYYDVFATFEKLDGAWKLTALMGPE